MFENKQKFFELLSDEQVQGIHLSSLEVLETVGVRVLHKQALKLFADVGAKVDFDKQTAYLPPALVEQWIKKAPGSFTVYARDETKNLKFENGITNTVSIQTTPFVYDLDTGQRRSATYADAQNLSTLCDVLEYMADGYCMVHPQDVPEHAAHAYMMMAQITNSSKAIKGRAHGKQAARDCIQMAEMLAGGEKDLRAKPNIHVLISTLSPLMLDKVQIEGLMEYVAKGLPCIMASAVMSGATGPVTLPGTIVQTNAEVLAHIILAQMISPGTPVVYGSASTVIDMKTSFMRYGAIEQGLINVAVAQLARYYQIPSRVVGGTTDSKALDYQAGIESTRNLFLATLAGANYVSCSAGGIDFGMSTSYEKVLIDHENIATIARMFAGFNTSPEYLSLDVVKDVGPGGHFLSHDQTLDMFREAHFIPEFANTEAYSKWVESKNDIVAKARDRVKDILGHHQKPQMDEHLYNELNHFIKCIEKQTP